MVATIPFNYAITNNAAGSFTTYNDGGVQGTFQDDPSTRYALRGGILLSTETLPMWGGVGIFEDIPNPLVTLPAAELGCPVGRATAITGGSSPLSGFTVFNQAYNMATTPQSNVPLAASGMTMHYFRLGSGARIDVAIDPSLVSLEGGLVSQQVSWDFGAQRLIPYAAAYPANVLVGLSYNAGTGLATGTTTTAHGLVAGDDFTISGVTPAGYNGNWTAAAGTTGSVLVWAIPTNPGVVTTQGTLNAGGGALPCKINRISTGNSMIVAFNSVTGFASWVYNGNTAEITI